MSIKSMTTENLPDIINVKELSAYLSISIAAAYNLLNSSDFPTLQLGKRKLVPKEKLLTWIDEKTGGENN